MVEYSMKEYELIKIVPSENPKKKYTATLRNKKTQKEVNINFGGIKNVNTQYYDILGHYSKYNNYSKEKRDNYYSRHGEVKKGYYSPRYFSHVFLWPRNINFN